MTSNPTASGSAAAAAASDNYTAPDDGPAPAPAPDAAHPEAPGKVAPVDGLFWATKLAATTLGETGGDLLSMTLGLGYAASTGLVMAVFGVALAAQLASRRYRPPVFWLVMLCTLVGGTTLSDFLDRTLGLGYMKTSILVAATLGAVLAAWRMVEGDLTVDRVGTRRAEAFYWTAVMVSNTLGTALGDFLADDSGLGFAGGALLTGSILAALLALWRSGLVSPVALFWMAFIVTRPFGAAFGDVLTKPRAAGGLAWGPAPASAALGLLVAALVWAAARRRAGAERARPAAEVEPG